MAKIYGKTVVGEGTFIGEDVIVGYPGKEEKHLLIEGRMDEVDGAKIGAGCTIRDDTIIYSNAELGDNVQTGHNVLVRENTKVGDNSLIGTGTIIENQCQTDSFLSDRSRRWITAQGIRHQPGISLNQDIGNHRGIRTVCHIEFSRDQLMCQDDCGITRCGRIQDINSLSLIVNNTADSQL